MELIEKKENQIVFKTTLSESLANSIRRYVGEIPIYAIDEVEIFKNDSAMYDETIAHRLGLLSLKMDKLSKEPKFKLSVKGPGIVYAKDLNTPAIVYGKTPLTVLKQGQELELVATTKIGRGVEHSKFSSGLMFYRNLFEVILNKKDYESIGKDLINLNAKEKGDKIIISDDKSKSILDVCESVCEKSNKPINLNKTGNLIITLESFGQLTPKEIISKAIKEFKKDLNIVSKNLK